MDDVTAKKHLNMYNRGKYFGDIFDDFTQLELVKSYKTRTDEIHGQLQATDDESDVAELANEQFNISNAYIVLRDDAVLPDGVEQQPLVIFTDASVRGDCETAAFGIVAKNLEKDFTLPLEVLDKYNIQAEPESSNELCILSGVVANFDVHATEMMAILAALEIFRHSVFETGQSIVFYTDSLLSKKVLGDKRLPPGTKKYSGIKKMFKKIIDLNALDVNVKKVAAHAGIELNELADMIARRRLV